ncbi:FmdB family zinc ribbon protein [Desulfolucanica intricata]|uniref:FmdB family zinc ribbon protein n=1 Tax=Desulfolucanica intricata TaxID=1285191 RepID=UPI000A3DC911|nr:zinc ribbon domain-containing protein [Desulfolucanica intricata]
MKGDEINMPIYEFRCLKCGELFEKLFINPKEEVKLECPKCKSDSFERVISKTNYQMGTGKSGGKTGTKPSVETKSCSPGSGCTTLEIPGYER